MAASPERSDLENLAEAVQPQPLGVVPPPQAKARKCNPAPGVRMVGHRIYDPQNGKTCHQCRQKTTGVSAACRKEKKKGLCPIKYCKKCLLNRYGEDAEKASENNKWTCPKCRGICNCSCCRKKNGEMPTGIMAHLAKASGCSSVHDLLVKTKTSEVLAGSEEVAAAQAILKVNASEKQGTKRAQETDVATGEVVAEGDQNDEGDENVDIDVNAVPSGRIKKKLKRRHSVQKNPADGDSGEPLLRDESTDAPDDNIVLPKGILITNIAGVELDSEIVGAAIQFIEFCRAFAEFFEIRKGQATKILQDIFGGRERRSVSSQVADLHIALLSVIQEGRGKKPLSYTRDGDAWIIDVGKCFSASFSMSQELPPNCFNGALEYKNLSPSNKLRVLNFLCDESLCTDELRNWIEDQNELAAKPLNAAKEKAHAAKEKEKELSERLKKSMDKTTLMLNEASTIEENKDILSQIKEAQKAKRAALNDMATMKKQQNDLWTKPLMVEKGLAYWKLEGCCDNATILLQEYGDFELTGNNDKWFMYTEDEENIIKDYIATRSRRQIRKRIQV